jgi:DNA-binding response OmpR family regulator
MVTSSRLAARISSSTVMRRRVYEALPPSNWRQQPSIYVGLLTPVGVGVTSPLPDIALTLRACGARDHGVMERGTILVVDDEPNTADLVELYLAREGYRVLQASTGEGGLEAVSTHRPRLVVLDVGLPDIDGLEVVKRLRQTSQIPVIFLTARDGEVDRVLGLELGGDDYLTKPFSPAELVARVKAVLRRVDGGPAAAEVMQAGEVAIDAGRREVRVAGEPVEFTTKEFDLLRYLAERPGLALSRQQILDGVWGYDWYGDARTVDVHIAQVRKKLGETVEITTVRGVGYRLES